MPSILEAYVVLPRPRLSLSNWLASLPPADREALWAQTRAFGPAFAAAERDARLRNMASRDAPEPLTPLAAIAAELRGLRDDLLQQPLTPAPYQARPAQRPQYMPQPPKPAPPKATGVSIPSPE